MLLFKGNVLKCKLGQLTSQDRGYRLRNKEVLLGDGAFVWYFAREFFYCVQGESSKVEWWSTDPEFEIYSWWNHIVIIGSPKKSWNNHTSRACYIIWLTPLFWNHAAYAMTPRWSTSGSAISLALITGSILREFCAHSIPGKRQLDNYMCILFSFKSGKIAIYMPSQFFAFFPVNIATSKWYTGVRTCVCGAPLKQGMLLTFLYNNLRGAGLEGLATLGMYVCGAPLKQ